MMYIYRRSGSGFNLWNTCESQIRYDERCWVAYDLGELIVNRTKAFVKHEGLKS